MTPKDLIVRCYAEKRGGQWQVICIDLNLAAQDRSIEKAKVKLNAQIAEYVYDAVAGEDRDHADELLSRKAPLSLRAKYYRIYAAHQLIQWKDGVHQLFKLSMPLVPKRA